MKKWKNSREKCRGIRCHAIFQEDRRNEEADTLFLLSSLTLSSQMHLLSVLQV